MLIRDAALVLSCVSILGCGDDDCVAKHYGGGTFVVTLTGDLEASVHGQGMSEAEIERWLGESSAVPTNADDYPRGAVLTRGGFGTVFVGSTPVARGAFDGCDAASLLGVWVEDDFAKFNLFSEGGGAALARGSADALNFDDGIHGSAQFDAVPSALGGACFTGRQQAHVEISWDLKRSTRVRREMCDDDGLGLGGW